MPLTAEPDIEIDLSTMSAFEFETPCEALGYQKARFEGFHRDDSHPADWTVLKSCGCSINLCDEWYQYGLWYDPGPNGLTMFCGRCDADPVRYVNAIPIRSLGRT